MEKNSHKSLPEIAQMLKYSRDIGKKSEWNFIDMENIGSKSHSIFPRNDPPRGEKETC